MCHNAKEILLPDVRDCREEMTTLTSIFDKYSEPTSKRYAAVLGIFLTMIQNWTLSYPVQKAYSCSQQDSLAKSE